ncbi:MAG: hypothetical protein GX159_03990 [Flavobacteriaceae bacterium]|nr:hypothetical protein [Flavobacteriaceae bacterium]
MMIKVYSILLFLIFVNSSAQDHFPIKIGHFSDQYEAKIDLNKKDTLIEDRFDVFQPEYIIQVLNKSNQKVILETYMSDFPTYLLDENNEAIPNLKELPYGSQSVLIYEDFNFDGIEDLALMNGYGSCYGGPSFDIYLAEKQSFNYSEAFSQLSNEYCGMFETDPDEEKIYTMTKSGCCWHQFSQFRVENNAPVAERIIEEGMNLSGVVWDFVEKNRVGDKMIETNYSLLDEAADIELLYGMSFSNGKKMEIYRSYSYEDFLFYIFKDKEDKIELFYYFDFVYDKKNKILSFVNSDVEYQIHKNGIKILMPKRTLDMKAEKIEAPQSFKNFGNLELKNLILN